MTRKITSRRNIWDNTQTVFMLECGHEVYTFNADRNNTGVFNVTEILCYYCIKEKAEKEKVELDKIEEENKLKKEQQLQKLQSELTFARTYLLRYISGAHFDHDPEIITTRLFAMICYFQSQQAVIQLAKTIEEEGYIPNGTAS